MAVTNIIEDDISDIIIQFDLEMKCCEREKYRLEK